jgi:hypothetical protein
MTVQALTISDSHNLAIPAGALFHPKMLTIGVSTSRAEYQRLGQGLSRLDDASQLWSCDFCLFGIRNWGKEDGLQLAHEATGFTKGTCKKLAYIAERFTPEHRPDGFTRAHFRALLPFPQDWLNTWLPTIENRRPSSKGVRALAIEAFGSDPSQRPSLKKMTSVSIPSALYARLVELNATHPSELVEAIVTAWLTTSPEEQASALAVAVEIKRERKNQRSRERRKEKKPKVEKPAPEKIVEPADVKYQVKKLEESKRQTYAERRQEQLANGAEPVPVKERKYTSKVRICFTECRGKAFVERSGRGGRLTPLYSPTSGPSSYSDEAKAEAAAAEYSADRGYLCEAFFCVACSMPDSARFVYHVRAATKPAPIVTAS